MSSEIAREFPDQERRSPTGIARERETSADRPGALFQILVTRDRETERRSPTGIARERETSADNPERPSRSSSRVTAKRSAGLRPASRGSAKPAPTTRSALPDPHAREETERRSPTGIARERETSADNPKRPSRIAREHSPKGAPVSDRHRAGARNQRRQPGAPFQILVTRDRETERRSPTGIARERETSADNPERSSRSSSRVTAKRSAGLRPASRGSAKPAPTTRSALPDPRHA